MKVGDLIEVRGGYEGIVLAREMMHPGHPESTVRNLVVHFRHDCKPACSWMTAEGRKVSIFAVDKVLSASKKR
jgi:hypothetical protein